MCVDLKRKSRTMGENITGWQIGDCQCTPVNIVMPSLVWRKMTPHEYAEQHKGFGKHVAVSQEIDGCQEVWVFLGGTTRFQEVEWIRLRDTKGK